MFKTKEKIESWLKHYGIKNYTINDNLTVDVHDTVHLENKNLSSIPVQFGIVQGCFYCQNNYLFSLEGCPYEVTGDFYCSNNFLSDLRYSPKIVRKNFYCNCNPIKSIKKFYTDLGKDFYHHADEDKFIIKDFKDFYKKVHYGSTLQISGKELYAVLLHSKLKKAINNNEEKEKKKLKI